MCHKLNYAYIQHMVSFSWEKLTRTHTHTDATEEHPAHQKHHCTVWFLSDARCLLISLCQEILHPLQTYVHFIFSPYMLSRVCRFAAVRVSCGVTFFLWLSSPEPPSAPQQLISVVNETSVVLEWAPPRRLGGRSDTSYSLECLICQTASHSQTGGRVLPRNRSITQPEVRHNGLGMQSDQGIVTSEIQPGRGVFQSRPVPGEYSGLGSGSRSQTCLPCGPDVFFSPGQTGLKSTRVVVSELRAHTHYTFIVHSRNGVSQASGAGAAQSASVTVTTNQAGEE